MEWKLINTYRAGLRRPNFKCLHFQKQRDSLHLPSDSTFTSNFQAFLANVKAVHFFVCLPVVFLVFFKIKISRKEVVKENIALHESCLHYHEDRLYVTLIIFSAFMVKIHYCWLCFLLVINPYYVSIYIFGLQTLPLCLTASSFLSQCN